MVPFLYEHWGNPGSAHARGPASAVENATAREEASVLPLIPRREAAQTALRRRRTTPRRVARTFCPRPGLPRDTRAAGRRPLAAARAVRRRRASRAVSRAAGVPAKKKRHLFVSFSHSFFPPLFHILWVIVKTLSTGDNTPIALSP